MCGAVGNRVLMEVSVAGIRTREKPTRNPVCSLIDGRRPPRAHPLGAALTAAAGAVTGSRTVKRAPPSALVLASMLP
jgi:hypothetical protein